MKVAMILSGCGYLDGAEIRESVLALLYLDQRGVAVDVFAPDIDQASVINHQTGQAMQETRNVLVEAARISRGNVTALGKLNIADYDGLVMPGGYGAAKNLSNLAEKGADCSILPELKTLLVQAVKQGKPIAAICIAPAVLAVALKGAFKPTLTIGEDAGTANVIEACGAVHQRAATTECVADEASGIYSCSAYMRDASLADVAAGIEKTIQAFVTKLSLAKGEKAA